MRISFELAREKTLREPGVISVERADDYVTIVIDEEKAELRDAIFTIFEGYKEPVNLHLVVRKRVVPDDPQQSAPFDAMIEELPDVSDPEKGRMPSDTDAA